MQKRKEREARIKEKALKTENRQAKELGKNAQIKRMKEKEKGKRQKR